MNGDTSDERGNKRKCRMRWPKADAADANRRITFSDNLNDKQKHDCHRFVSKFVVNTVAFVFAFCTDLYSFC